MNEYSLTKIQVQKLASLVERFPNVTWFTLVDGPATGIGPTTHVKFSLFGDDDKDNDTTIDITDVSTW